MREQANGKIVPQCVLKAVKEILNQVNTQRKADRLIVALQKKEKQANPNITDKER